MYICENCQYYEYNRVDEFAGKVGQCRYNPPTWNNHRDLNNFPQVKANAWCGKHKKGS